MSTDPIGSALRRALHLDPPADFETSIHDHARRVVHGEIEPRHRPVRLRVVVASTLAVAAVAAGAVAVVQNRAAHLSKTAPAASPSLPIPSPTLQGVVVPAPTPAPTPQSTVLPALLPQQVLDLSWISSSEGWALLQETCGASQCERVAHTTDGVHWSDVGPVPSSAAGCTSNGPCITKIRFASARVGYLFGDLLLITGDGGRTWRNGSGLTNDLEVAGGTAVRITAPTPDDGGLGRHFSVQVAPVGSDTWRTVLDPAPGPGGPPLLQRDGAQRIYVTTLGNSAGGAVYVSPIATSADGGTTWSQIADPCTQYGQDPMLLGMSAAPSGRLAVTCLIRSSAATTFAVRQSTNAGSSFGAAQTMTGWDGYGIPEQPLLLPDGTLVTIREQFQGATVSDASVEVSHDGGRTWTRTADLGALAANAYVTALGFQDARTGRVAAGGTLWTTHDGGSTWTRSQI